MSVSTLISKRLGSGSLTSKTSARVAVVTIWVSVAIMVLALLITMGFRSAISAKIYDFVGAVEISAVNPLNLANIDTPVFDDDDIASFNNLIAPQSMTSVVQAGGVLQNGDGSIGVAMLGVQGDINEGEIKISASAASELGVRQGEKIDLVVMGVLPMRKRMNIVEVFSTGIVDMERSVVIVKQELARNLSGIDSASVSYYTINGSVGDMDALTELCEEYGLTARSAEQRMPQIFDWLDMIDQNMALVFIIMMIVAVIGIVSATLISILEHLPTIATLRAIGMRGGAVRMVFVKYMWGTILKGICLGLITGLGLGAVQAASGFVSLDGGSYFIDVVPIDFHWMALLYLLVGVLVVTILATILPTSIISRMGISSSLKFS